MNPHIVGRDAPLEQLDRFVRALGGGPSSLVIQGEAGIGKTTLWQVAVDAAAERGCRVLASRPAESETALAYSGLADLLAHVDATAFEELPGPQRQALEVALLLTEPTGRPPEPRAVFTAFGGVLRALAGTGAILIAVDDLQWLDRNSLRALEFVSRRFDSEPVGILATERLGAAARAGLPEATVLRLGSLSPAALHRLVKGQVGVSLPRSTVLRMHRMTSGNPFFALELARVLVAADLPGSSDPWPVPDDLRELVGVRVRRLPKAAAAELLVAAAGGASSISGLTDSALRTAAREGIVTVGQHGQVRFVHPLFAAAIYEGAALEERRNAHRSLAARESNLEQRARHRALASDGPDEEVAQLLHEAAARARSRGAPDVAAELEERSFTLTPPDRPRDAWGRGVTAAEHHFHAGDLQRAKDLLVGLIDTAEPGPPRSRLLRLLGEASYHLGSLDDALAFLQEAVDAANGDPASVATAETELAFALSSSFRSFKEGNAAAGRALTAAEALDDNGLLSTALAVSAASDFLVPAKRLDETKLTRALELEDPDQASPLDRRPSFLAGLIFLQTEQLDRGRQVLERLRRLLVERGEESDLPELLAVLARLECVAGNFEEAGRLADHGWELAHQASSDTVAAHTRAIRALADAHAGRIDETRAAAAEALELADRSGWQIAAFWATNALGSLELSLGNDEKVVTTLAPSIELAEELGVVEPSRQPFLPDAIEAFVHLGELERAERLTRLLEERGRAFGRAWAIVTGARCRALVLAAQGDVAAALTTLDLVLAEQPLLPMPLENARTLLVRGQLERRRKQKRAAGESLRRALELCEEIGAALWAERARAELQRLGRIDDPDHLTATETRVARLAASGLTNRQIAASAFMSQKTVEANLSRIYRKLGIRSRAELGLRLAEREPA